MKTKNLNLGDSSSMLSINFKLCRMLSHINSKLSAKFHCNLPDISQDFQSEVNQPALKIPPKLRYLVNLVQVEAILF